MLGLISKERQQDLLTLKDLIEAGKLTPVIDRTYPLREAPRPYATSSKATRVARSCSPSQNRGVHSLRG